MINKILEWTACVLTLAGAICTSLQYDPLNIYLLNTGSFIYLIWSIRINKPSLMVINGGLLVIYAVGFILRT